MVRLLKFLGLWILLIFAGLVAVALSTFAATFLRSEGLVTGVLAVGLACMFPVSLEVAPSHFYPARPAPRTATLCPHCGGLLPTPDPNLQAGLWPDF